MKNDKENFEKTIIVFQKKYQLNSEQLIIIDKIRKESFV